MILFIIGLVVGGAISWWITDFYAKKSSKELKAEIKKLHDAMPQAGGYIL